MIPNLFELFFISLGWGFVLTVTYMWAFVEEKEAGE